MNYTPRPYQMKALQMMGDQPGAALLLDPGLGKTSITLAFGHVLKARKMMRGILVVCPLRPLRLTWPAEIAKWGFDLTYALAVGTPDERRAALASGADVILINPENMVWMAEHYGAKKGADGKWSKVTKKMPFDVLVVDESTRFKNTQSKRFQALKHIINEFDRRYILTGTPAPQSLEDLFGQVYICDGGKRLGSFITHFRRTYFDESVIPIGGGRYVSEWTPRADSEQAIFNKISDMALRLSAEDHLQMPDRIENIIPVELPADARRVYEKMENEFVVRMGSNTVTAATAAAVGMKLRQITNGFAYGSLKPEVIHSAKLEALADLIEEQEGQPLLVAVSFVEEVKMINEYLRQNGHKEAPYLGGGVGSAKADAIVESWNAGRVPVLLAHPTSVAHGLNLQAGGSTVCWFGLTWNLEEHIQFNARVYRQGQKKTVIVHYLIAKDTIDERVLQVLRSKDRAQSKLFESLKRMAKGA